ncbi:MAG: solute carrier family 23 protein, partial [Bacteroidota bacterium]
MDLAGSQAGGGSQAGFLERIFHISERGSTVGKELAAGITTFMTMAYILFVNPDILSAAGVPAEGAAVATALAAAVATLAMGLYANYPFALASGMGLNAALAF